jgi:pimeloyl-ACP methyl ester carboxylesterase
MTALGDSFHVTAFDRPGNGFSGDTGSYSFEHNADVALALIDALKLEHVIVVGHSYGGATALAMALRNPASVDAYVIVDSATYTPSRQPDLTLRMLAIPRLGLGLATVVGPRVAPSKIRKGLIDVFGGRIPPEDFVALRTRIWATPKVTHAIAEETLGSAEGLRAMSSRYGTIQRPVYILAEADNAFRRATAERLHREIQGSSLELLPGAGHYLQVEKTADVVAAINQAAVAP